MIYLGKAQILVRQQAQFCHRLFDGDLSRFHPLQKLGQMLLVDAYLLESNSYID